ncbi:MULTISPECIES: winged helix-turn-helix domain-containing protein [unclassified Lebetimonas]|uniref:winged helix-turn-helix domain-containing protein n=1 Tax=unclassified Lebetimonas TaxID=2648158 RepID=UPI0004B0DC05|nr:MULTISPECIES: LysR family transcriptional regulator [unclassified Lebetimonas]
MIKELIEKYKNDENKLTCAKAYVVAKKAGVEPIVVGKTADEMGVRITDCGLGQFGGLDFTDNYEEEIVKELEKLSDDKKRVFCKDARKLAEKYNLKKVRSAIKDNGFEVIYCELGVFKEKKRPRAFIKTKVWIENQKGELLFGKGKTEILELIEKEGSIAKAAEKMGLNYKKAWSHIKTLQKNLDDELVTVEKGVKGGTYLTPKAKEYIEIFKELESEIQEFANKRFKELFLKKLKGPKKKN